MDEQRKLMDLLAGWMLYLQTCEDNTEDAWKPPPGEADDIFKLYQLAGSKDMTRTQVAAFLQQHVIPLVLK